MGGLKVANVQQEVSELLAGTGTVTGTAMAGDVSGTVPANTVTGIQTIPVSPTPPTNGQALVYNSAAGEYVPTSIPGVTPTSKIWRPLMVRDPSADAVIGGTHWWVVTDSSGNAIMALL